MTDGAPTTILAPMRYATLVVNRLRDNEPFRPGAGPNGGDFFLPWRQLRERFAAEASSSTRATSTPAARSSSSCT